LKSLSIVTAHYNDTPQLVKTYYSLVSQTYKNWELIIIDSFTYNFYQDVDKNILNDQRVKIISLRSGIYDAMNYGILSVSTDYFQILNAGTIYTSEFILEKCMHIVTKFHEKYGHRMHLFQMEIMGLKNAYKNIPSPLFFPFRCGHEATIYPQKSEGKILHSQRFKVAADLFFLLEYGDFFKKKYYSFSLVKYPKGGRSDSDHKIKEKIFGNFLIFLKTLKRLRLISSLFAINRIIKDLIILCLNKNSFYRFLKNINRE
tara:strand:+ start:1862 stop:2638 length:777 start_codon:yes stop_codon:yes gene_type:complete